MNWPCQFCNLKFNNLNFCVLHELLSCPKNPKFKHKRFTILQDIKDKY